MPARRTRRCRWSGSSTVMVSPSATAVTRTTSECICAALAGGDHAGSTANGNRDMIQRTSGRWRFMSARICAASVRRGNSTLVTVLLLACALFARGAGSQEAAPAAAATPLVMISMQTTLGEIRVGLEQARAPGTVANFLRYVDAKRFDNITFYRAVKIDADGKYGLVQGGLKGDPKKLFKPIAHESPAATGLSHV